jgi:thioredoxin-like negative regulator of GroEL
MTTTAHVLEETRPRLLFFYSPTSGRSRRTEGHMAQVLQARGNHQTFNLTKISLKERPDLFERLKVDSEPTILVVENRRVKRRIVQPAGITSIREGLEEWLR